MERFAGKVALVTGASSGIGAAIVTALVKHGMTVIGCARRVEKVQELIETLETDKLSGTLEATHCDLQKEDDILAMFQMIKEKHGGVDVCVNNAGLFNRAPLLSGSTDSWRQMLDVNILAMSICTREAVNSMKDKGSKHGHIVNICSMSGHRLVRNPDGSFYQATKFMVKTLTEGVRSELRNEKSKIRISELSPGLVETELFSAAGGEDYSSRVFKNLKPLEPNDIADAVLYVLSAPPHVQVHDILMRPTEQVS